MADNYVIVDQIAVQDGVFGRRFFPVVQYDDSTCPYKLAAQLYDEAKARLRAEEAYAELRREAARHEQAAANRAAESRLKEMLEVNRAEKQRQLAIEKAKEKATEEAKEKAKKKAILLRKSIEMTEWERDRLWSEACGNSSVFYYHLRGGRRAARQDNKTSRSCYDYVDADTYDQELEALDIDLDDGAGDVVRYEQDHQEDYEMDNYM
jgi:hypothetical protein